MTAEPGSMALQTDGTIWRKATGVGNTGWVGLSAVGEGETVKDTDWTGLSTEDYAAGGDSVYTVDGDSWTMAGTANADTFGIVSSTGLRFNADGTNTNWSSSGATATRLFISLSNLIPNYSPFGTYVVELYFSSLTLGVNGNRIVAALSQSDSGGGNVRGGGPYRTSGEDRVHVQTQLTLNSGFDDSTMNAFAIRFDSSGLTVLGDTYSGGDFPSVYSRIGGFVQSPELDGGVALNGRAAFFTLAFPTGETSGNMDATLARSRVRRLN